MDRSYLFAPGHNAKLLTRVHIDPAHLKDGRFDIAAAGTIATATRRRPRRSSATWWSTAPEPEPQPPLK